MDVVCLGCLMFGRSEWGVVKAETFSVCLAVKCSRFGMPIVVSEVVVDRVHQSETEPRKRRRRCVKITDQSDPTARIFRYVHSYPTSLPNSDLPNPL